MSDYLAIVVDDNPLIVEILSECLNYEGFCVKGFTVGGAAVRWYAENHKGVVFVVLDINMPVMDGFECFDQMRKINSQQAIAFCSAEPRAVVEPRINALGPFPYFQKPACLKELALWARAQAGCAIPKNLRLA
jgi:two-component system response regulator AlgR